MPKRPQARKRAIKPVVNVDPDLINRAFKLSGERTREAVVTKALREFVARRSQKRLLDLASKLEWDTSFNYKADRTRG